MARNRKRRKQSSKDGSTKEAAAAAAPSGAAAAVSPRLSPSSSKKPITLEQFATLPHELKKHVIELACCSAPVNGPATGPTTRSRFDFITTLNFALASRSLYALVIPVLYTSVVITRPSSLASFHLAMTSKPALGRLVKNLHVGPCEVSPQWDPIDFHAGFYHSDCSLNSDAVEPSRVYIRSSMQSQAEVDLLPLWCQPDRKWPLDWYSVRSKGLVEVVFEALYDAQKTIGVNLRRSHQDYKGKQLSSSEHTIRLAEVQAALDLYLMMMRRWDDRHGITREQLPDDDEDDGGSMAEREEAAVVQGSAYPTLFLTGYAAGSRSSKGKSTAPEERYVLSRFTILQHLARRHSILDNFDHPLIFARSGESTKQYGSFWSDHGGRQELVGDDWDDYFAPDDCSPDHALPNTATLGSLLSLLSSVLSYASNVENISLTGFLERALCGSRGSAAVLKKLRFVTLGPPPKLWYAPLRLEHLAPGLEELRLCGIRLHKDELNAVLAMFPTLKRLQWSMMHKHSKKHRPR